MFLGNALKYVCGNTDSLNFQLSICVPEHIFVVCSWNTDFMELAAVGNTDSLLKVKTIRVPEHIFVCVH